MWRVYRHIPREVSINNRISLEWIVPDNTLWTISDHESFRIIHERTPHISHEDKTTLEWEIFITRYDCQEDRSSDHHNEDEDTWWISEMSPEYITKKSHHQSDTDIAPRQKNSKSKKKSEEIAFWDTYQSHQWKMYEEISCDIIRIPKCRNNTSRTLDSCTVSEWWEWGYAHIFEYSEECNYWRWYEWSK